MSTTTQTTSDFSAWIREKILMGRSPRNYLRSLITPFNIVAALILAVGIPVIGYRFANGLGAATNMSDTNPWGIWIGFDMLTGVALAAGGYVLAGAVYIFGLRDYHPILRPAILTGFLGYFIAVLGLITDLGQPWRLPYPVFVSFGVGSVLFLVAWHVFLYLTVQFLEFSPAICEWLGWKRVRRWVSSLTIGLTIIGITLSILHQSALGALFLLMPTKLHPLWYSQFIPIFFFVSSIVGGLTMVIIESTLSHRIFRGQLESERHVDLDDITIGLGKAASIVLFAYFFLKLLGIADGNHWNLLNTPFGYWFLVEVLGFVLLPCFLFAFGVRAKNVKLIRFTAVLTVIGLAINRLNVAVIAYNWNVTDRYSPSWMEILITVTLITTGILMFRWIVNRMPVLYTHKEFSE